MSIENPQCMWVVYEEKWLALSRMQEFIKANCKDCPVATDIQVETRAKFVQKNVNKGFIIWFHYDNIIRTVSYN